MKDKETLQKYGPHEAHQKVVEQLKEFLLDSPICLDWEI